jgi:hypothetical protein
MCRRRDRSSVTLPIRLNLQLLRKTREDSATGFRDDYHVFLTRTAHAGVIQTRFNCEHLPILQNNFLQARMFVDFQTQPMAGTVEKSNAPALTNSGCETATGKEFLNGFVNRHAVDAGFDSL